MPGIVSRGSDGRDIYDAAARGCELLWQSLDPDRDVIMVPVRPFHADAVHAFTHLVNLVRDLAGQ